MKRPKKVLLLGAGGMGMAPLALYLRGAGVRVEAFDDRFSEPLRSHLKSHGVKILDELNPIKTPDCIIHSSALSRNDDRLSKFKDLNIPFYRRGDFLAKLFARKRIIAVVGSHGKTSVTGRLVWALKNCGFEATYLVGAQFHNFQLPAGFYSKSKWVVMEVDESDGSIDGYNPWMTVILNCDWDHVDLYKKRSSLVETLENLLSRTKQSIVYAETKVLTGIVRKIKNRRLYPFKHCEEPAKFLVANERAVLESGNALGLDFSNLNFSKFPGMQRRQGILFESSERVVIEDYAHHPTEIASILRMRGELLPDHKLKVVFQPHRYSRTKAFAPSFAEELSHADELYLLQTYAAFEPYDQLGTVESLSGYLPPRLREDTKVYNHFRDLRLAIGQNSKMTRDQVLFLGAGDLWKWAHAFSAWQLAGEVKQDAFGYFLDGLMSPQSKLVENAPLGSMTTMGVGGGARWYCEPAHTEDLSILLQACEFFELPRSMLGRGSNLIVPDQGFGGLVIRLRGEYWKTIDLRTEQTLIVGAGAKLKEICKFACNKNLKGFEFLEGIPGTLGGALRMNAGAMGREIFDLVEWVKFLMPDGKVRQIQGDELEVGYRYCKEAYEGIALRAKLRSQGKAQHLEIRKIIDQLSNKRRKNQPQQASSGCIFRNPVEHPAGWLIDQAGLKGEKVGGAGISEIHGNFIVNHGGATSEHVIELIQRVKKRVKDSQGVILEPEVNLLGKSWNQYLS